MGIIEYEVCFFEIDSVLGAVDLVLLLIPFLSRLGFERRGGGSGRLMLDSGKNRHRPAGANRHESSRQHLRPDDEPSAPEFEALVEGI